MGDQAEILNLDMEVLAGHTASITAWLPLRAAPHRGSGLRNRRAGTFALLERFPEAEVTAVDCSPAHLHRLEQNAAAGAADRVRLVQTDLDAANDADRLVMAAAC